MSEGGRLVYSRLVGGMDGMGLWKDGNWDWWVLDRQNEEPLWHGGGRECGTGKGATRGKGDRAVDHIGGGTSTGEREDTVLERFLCKKGLTMPLDIS